MKTLLQEINNLLKPGNLSEDVKSTLLNIKYFFEEHLAKHEIKQLEDEALSNYLSSVFDFWEDIMPSENFQKWKKLNKIEF